MKDPIEILDGLRAEANLGGRAILARAMRHLLGGYVFLDPGATTKRYYTPLPSYPTIIEEALRRSRPASTANGEHEQWQLVVSCLVRELLVDNPRFNEEEFRRKISENRVK